MRNFSSQTFSSCNASNNSSLKQCCSPESFKLSRDVFSILNRLKVRYSSYSVSLTPLRDGNSREDTLSLPSFFVDPKRLYNNIRDIFTLFISMHQSLSSYRAVDKSFKSSKKPICRGFSLQLLWSCGTTLLMLWLILFQSICGNKLLEHWG